MTSIIYSRKDSLVKREVLKNTSQLYLGRFLGDRIFQIPFLNKMVNKEKIKVISSYYHKYGLVTLLLGRFIPFGVRNGLFLTAGIGKMNPIKFALSDLMACTISSLLYFYLYYTFGNEVIKYIKHSNIIIFLLAILILIIFLIKKYSLKKKETFSDK